MKIKIENKDVAASRAKALARIKEILNKGTGNIDTQFTDRSGNYYSSDKFIVTWTGNYKGMPSEFGVDKTDAFYEAYSGGIKAISVVRGLFHERQLKAYGSIEIALIDAGIKLCSVREEKIEFFKKYAEPYNERIKKLKQEKASA